MSAPTETEARKKVLELIKDIKVALLVTHDAEGHMHARPMVAVEREESGLLWFFTRGDSPKIAEIEKNPEVLLSYSNSEKQDYVSIGGRAEVRRDKAKVKQLWSEPMRTWFPKGPEESDIALICVHAERAEYWDSPSSAFVYAYGYIKARLTGEMPHPGENKKVAF